MKKDIINILFDCIQNFFMCCIISISMMFLLGYDSIKGVMLDIALSWCVNMAFDLIVPIGMIGTVIADKTTKGKVPHYLVQILVISTMNVTAILIAMLSIKVGPNALFVDLLKKTWILLEIIAYMGALLCTPVTKACISKISKKNEQIREV